MSETKEQPNQNKKWYGKAITIFVILLSITAIVTLSYYYHKKSTLLYTCNSNLQNLQNEKSDLTTKLDTSNSGLQKCNSDLQTCQDELNQFQSSPSYYYSIRMHPKDVIIKQQAATAIKEFEDSQSCLEYGSNAQCSSYDSYGNCISYSQVQYCKKENYAKTYYNSLDKLDVGKETGMEHYYAEAIIANYYWVRNNINYVLGAAGTGSQTDLQTLELKAGKCDEKAILLASLLRSVGVEAYPVTIAEINHAITAVRFEGYDKTKLPGWTITSEGKDYLLLDATCDSCEISDLSDMDKGKSVSLLKFYNVN